MLMMTSRKHLIMIKSLYRNPFVLARKAGLLKVSLINEFGLMTLYIDHFYLGKIWYKLCVTCYDNCFFVNKQGGTVT